MSNRHEKMRRIYASYYKRLEKRAHSDAERAKAYLAELEATEARILAVKERLHHLGAGRKPRTRAEPDVRFFRHVKKN